MKKKKKKKTYTQIVKMRLKFNTRKEKEKNTHSMLKNAQDQISRSNQYAGLFILLLIVWLLLENRNFNLANCVCACFKDASHLKRFLLVKG